MMKPADSALGIKELNLFAQETLRQMGHEALVFYGKGRQNPPFDQDLVTQAELHLHAAFQQIVFDRFPDHQIFGHEPLDEGYTHDAKRFLWVFDPLDGVDNFQTGIPVWGMSLSLYENHWPVMGLFFMPVTHDLFRANPGAPAFWNDHPIEISQRHDISQESLILTFSRFHQSYQCRFPGKIRALGSTGAHICYVAMGRADAAIIANESFQDLAAARVILESAGGHWLKIDGSDFFLGDYIDGRKIEEHVLITAPGKEKILMDCMKRL
jgi:myo-inositol-1(or 4)-monophosphatase